MTKSQKKALQLQIKQQKWDQNKFDARKYNEKISNTKVNNENVSSTRSISNGSNNESKKPFIVKKYDPIKEWNNILNKNTTWSNKARKLFEHVFLYPSEYEKTIDHVCLLDILHDESIITNIVNTGEFVKKMKELIEKEEETKKRISLLSNLTALIFRKDRIRKKLVSIMGITIIPTHPSEGIEENIKENIKIIQNQYIYIDLEKALTNGPQCTIESTLLLMKKHLISFEEYIKNIIPALQEQYWVLPIVNENVFSLPNIWETITALPPLGFKDVQSSFSTKKYDKNIIL